MEVTENYESTSDSFSKRGNNYRTFEVSGGLTGANDSYSISFSTTSRKKIGLWKLTESFNFRSLTVGENLCYEQDPSAQAMPVYLCRGETVENTSRIINDNEKTYREESHNRIQRLYDPTFRNAHLVTSILSSNDTLVSRLLPYQTGDLVRACYNSQSERWEIFGESVDFVRGRLTTNLVLNTGEVHKTAIASVIVYDSLSDCYTATSAEIHVVDFLGIFSGQIGDYCYCRRFADRPNGSSWEIVSL